MIDTETHFAIIREAGPVPPKAPGRKTPHPGFAKRRIYPWNDLNVGDAFDVPIETEDPGDNRYPEFNRLTANLTERHKRHPERYEVRVLMHLGVVRCWRVR